MNLKPMKSRFGGRCKTCRKPISVGDKIYWKTGLTLCPECATGGGSSNEENTPAQVTSAPDETGKYSTDWADFRHVLKDALAGDISKIRGEGSRQEFRELTQGNRGSRFYGYSPDELSRWVNKGYTPEALQGLAEFIPPVREKRRLQFNEDEGELLLDVAWSGADNYFAEWTKRESIPGLSVVIRMGVRAGTPAEVLNQFNIWLARTIYSLESAGVDCAVSLLNKNRGAFTRIRGITEHRLVLKKENEKADYLSISTVLSPAQHRSVMFALRAYHASKANEPFSYGQGASVNERNEWSIDYDAESGELLINCPHEPRTFPEQVMTDKLREILHTLHK